jgi:hypothetical protein
MTTYVYDCMRCWSHDELPPSGGKLSCLCENGWITVTKIVDGAVVFSGRTMEDMLNVPRESLAGLLS